MNERTPFTVISNDDPQPAALSPSQAAFNEALMDMVKMCIGTNPSVVMMTWESMTPDGPEMRSSVLPPSEAVLRGMIEMMRDQLLDRG